MSDFRDMIRSARRERRSRRVIDPQPYIGEIIGDIGGGRFVMPDNPLRRHWLVEVSLAWLAWIALLAFLLFFAGALFLIGRAQAFDSERFKDATPEIRQWFKSMKSPSGALCCDISDGHRTEWKADAAGIYWVLIDNDWQPVPEKAVIPNARNPLADAVVWFNYLNGVPFIRCFVPGPGA